MRVIFIAMTRLNMHTITFLIKGGSAYRNYYSLAVGDDADVSTHTECGSAGTAGSETDAKYVVPCRAVGRYLSIERSGQRELHFMALCEVIIMGYVFNGDDSTSKCDVIYHASGCVFFNVSSVNNNIYSMFWV